MLLNGVKLAGTIHLAINLVIALFIILLVIGVGKWLKKLLLLALNESTREEYEKIRRQEIMAGDRHKKKRKIKGVTIPNDPHGELGKFVQKSELRYFNILFSIGIWSLGIVLLIQVGLPGIVDIFGKEYETGVVKKDGEVYKVEDIELVNKVYTDPIYRTAIRDISEKVDDGEIYYTLDEIDESAHIYDVLVGKEVKVYKNTGILYDDNSKVKELQKAKKEEMLSDEIKDKIFTGIEDVTGVDREDIDILIDALSDEDKDKLLEGEISDEKKEELEKKMTEYLEEKMGLDKEE